ncbi:MAG: hypothetical protein WDM87_02610 [Terracidiphilus sp.]
MSRLNLCKASLFAVALAGLFATAPLKAQTPATSTQAPASATQPTPAAQPASAAQPVPAAQASPAIQTSPSGHPNNAYWNDHDKQLLVDFGWLEHFKEANAMLTPPCARRRPCSFHGRFDHGGMEA